MRHSLAVTITALLVVAFIALLFVAPQDHLRAQTQSRAFVDLLRPYVNSKVIVDSGAPITLRAVESDYILLEPTLGAKRALAIHSIRSIILDSTPIITLER